MSAKARKSLKRMIRKAKEGSISYVVDGYSGFFLSTADGKPLTGTVLCNRIRHAIDYYNKKHKDKMPSVTPHLLRHTFCTNMINKGVPIKDVQYLMGHSDVSMTMNIYTNTTYERVEKNFLDGMRTKMGG